MDHTKQAGVVIFDKVDFRLKSARRDNEGPFILIKEAIHLEKKIAFLNIYVPNTSVPNYANKKKTTMNLKVQVDSNTVVVGDLNTPLSLIDRTSRQKNNKETSELLNTLDH
jgi:hypothetical protein